MSRMTGIQIVTIRNLMSCYFFHFSMSVSSGDSDDDVGVDRVDGTSANKVRQRSSSNIGGVVTGR